MTAENVTPIEQATGGNTKPVLQPIEVVMRKAKEIFPWIHRDLEIPTGSDESVKGNEYLKPKIDNYIWNEFLVWRILSFVVNPCNSSALIYGPPGSGKTSFIENLAAFMNIPCMGLMAHNRLDFVELLITTTAYKGTIFNTDGPLLKAMKYGWWFYIDETRLSPTDTMTSMNDVIERAQAVIPDMRNRLETAHPNFRLFFLDNTPLRGDLTGGFGNSKANEISVVDRVYSFQTTYPEAKAEVKWLVQEIKDKCDPGDSGRRNQLKKEWAEAFVELANRVRDIYDGKTGANTMDAQSSLTADQTFSTRRLFRFTKIMMEVGDIDPKMLPDGYDKPYEYALMESGWLTADPAFAMAVREVAKEIIG